MKMNQRGKFHVMITCFLCFAVGLYLEEIQQSIGSLSESAALSTKGIKDSGLARREMRYVHDDPKHPWHWTREHEPSRELGKKVDCNGKSYADLYDQFHEEGWVVFTSCSLQRNFDTVIEPVARLTANVPPEEGRADCAINKEVKDLALDPDTIELVEYLHGGRAPFPFQTLNFPKGTQQSLHSDLIHFDTMPRTLMTAAWVALEDMNEDNGPLRFYPKSHKYGTWDFAEVGMGHKYDLEGGDETQLQVDYGHELEKAMGKVGLNEVVASDMKKGQTFFWAAGLIHGGSMQKNMELSRLSQVTHYFFEGCEYYWTPRLSDLRNGIKSYKNIPFLRDCVHQYNVEGEEEFYPCAEGFRAKFRLHTWD